MCGHWPLVATEARVTAQSVVTSDQCMVSPPSPHQPRHQVELISPDITDNQVEWGYSGAVAHHRVMTISSGPHQRFVRMQSAI